MQDRERKTDLSTEAELQPSKAKKAASCLARIPIHRGDILGEETFRGMLALERRRAERSRQPFVLLLVDSTGIEADRRGAALAERLASVVSGAVRESDLIGWYQSQSVLAVIFTEVNLQENPTITEALCAKVSTALRANLGQAIASKLVLTVHLFPESWGSGRSDRSADSKLYPDVSGREAKQRFPLIIKRIMDVAGSLLLLVVLAPVLAAIAVAIKLTSRGPVIFKQERLGRFGKSFECLKFRTMFADNDPRIHREYVESFIAGKVAEGDRAGAAVYKIKDDPRVTPVGRLLRRASFDEIPQFWNVLRGEMALVGPRPPLPYEFAAYDFWHRRRVLEVKPGVTGLWQVRGRSRTSFDDMVRMDLRYCQRWSLWLDLKILLATPLAVFIGHGAY